MKHSWSETLSVGDLRKALEGLPDTLPVCVCLPAGIDTLGGFASGFAFTSKAHYCPASAISSPEFMIHCGETYDY